MKEIDKKFVSVMEQVHNGMKYEDDSTSIIDKMMPREGESIIGSLIRSRYAISEKLLNIMMDKEGFVTPERIDNIVGEKNSLYISPVVLPDGIETILDWIRSYTRQCSMNDDGSVIYHEDYYGHECGVSDMQTLTHAIVVGNALMLSDALLTDQDIENWLGKIDGLDEHVDISYTILDTINYIKESEHKIWSTQITNNNTPLSLHIRHIYHTNHIKSCADDTNLGVRMYKERREGIEDNYEMFSYFMDVGVLELVNILNIDPVASIIRYAIELWRDHDNNHIISGIGMINYFPDDMNAYINTIRWNIYFRARELKSVLKEIEEYDK